MIPLSMLLTGEGVKEPAFATRVCTAAQGDGELFAHLKTAMTRSAIWNAISRPRMTTTDICAAVGKKRQSVLPYLQELLEAGNVRLETLKNESGHEVWMWSRSDAS